MCLMPRPGVQVDDLRQGLEPSAARQMVVARQPLRPVGIVPELHPLHAVAGQDWLIARLAGRAAVPAAIRKLVVKKHVNWTPWIIGGISGAVLLLGAASVLALGLLSRGGNATSTPTTTPTLTRTPTPVVTPTPLPTMTILPTLSIPVAPTYTPWPTNTGTP